MPASLTVSWSQVSAFRLARHHLVASGNQADVAAVSESVCGIQAQVMSAAELQLWARIPDLKRAEVHSALWEDRSLVKTSCMRGTLHLLSAEDFPIYITALRRGRMRAMRQIMARYGVMPEEADAVTEIVVDFLEEGPKGKREITEHVKSLDVVGDNAKLWFDQSWWGVVRQALVEGLICYGPDRGQGATLVRVDQWLPKNGPVSGQQAQELLLRRYLSAYGPATLTDFARWMGVATAEVRPVWEALSEELVEVSIGEKASFILARDQKGLANSGLGDRKPLLLPYFDPYLLGHVDKSHLVNAHRYKRVYRKAGWISPVVLISGRVAGVWSYTRRARRISVEVEPFEKFSTGIRGRIEERVRRVGRFLETPCEVKFIK